jgi:hypothetical protein
MTTLTADNALVALLRQANDLAEVRDTFGNLVGYFAPVGGEQARLSAQAASRRRARINQAEADRQAGAVEKGYTTKEVFEHFQSLTEDEKERAYLQQKIDRLKERDACDTP